MVYDPRIHHRHSIRLKGFDYTLPGYYFITIVVRNRIRLFGARRTGFVRLSRWGRIADECWYEIPAHFPNVSLDAFIVMPDHIHGIVQIVESAPTRAFVENAWPRGPEPGSVGAIVGSYKAAVSRRINLERGTAGARIWHRDYWERIVRNERALAAIRRYILTNPSR